MFQKVMELFKPKEGVCSKPQQEEPKVEVPKEEVPKGEVPKEEIKPQGQYTKLAEEIFSSFELPNLTVKDVEAALEKTKGIFEEAIELLYNNLK